MYSSKSNVSLTSAINENIKMVNKQATNITNAQSNMSINNIDSVGMINKAESHVTKEIGLNISLNCLKH